MKSKLTKTLTCLALSFFAAQSFAAATTSPPKGRKFFQEPTTKAVVPSLPAQPEALKSFLEHSGFCEIFTGLNNEPDALSASYSYGVESLIPTGTPQGDIASIFKTVNAKCMAQLLTSISD